MSHGQEEEMHISTSKDQSEDRGKKRRKICLIGMGVNQKKQNEKKNYSLSGVRNWQDSGKERRNIANRKAIGGEKVRIRHLICEKWGRDGRRGVTRKPTKSLVSEDAWGGGLGGLVSAVDRNQGEKRGKRGNFEIETDQDKTCKWTSGNYEKNEDFGGSQKGKWRVGKKLSGWNRSWMGESVEAETEHGKKVGRRPPRQKKEGEKSGGVEGVGGVNFIIQIPVRTVKGEKFMSLG